MDQAAPADQELLRLQRERSEDANLDRRRVVSRSTCWSRSYARGWAWRRVCTKSYRFSAVRPDAGAACGATCAGRVAPTAWSASVRRLPRVGAGELLFLCGRRNGTIGQNLQAGEAARGVPNVAAVQNHCIAAVDRLPYPCQDGQKGNPGLQALQPFDSHSNLLVDPNQLILFDF